MKNLEIQKVREEIAIHFYAYHHYHSGPFFFLYVYLTHDKI